MFDQIPMPYEMLMNISGGVGKQYVYINNILLIFAFGSSTTSSSGILGFT